MSVLLTYLELGLRHILSPQATDHLAFLLALVAPYALADWRRLLALVTSFTLGHSLTLALATLGVVQVSPGLVETLIPLTIILTALLNLRRSADDRFQGRRRPARPSLLAAGFGLIHGLGFAGYLGALLGARARPVRELLAFNLGVELAQVLVVLALLGLMTLVLRRGWLSRRDWLLLSSGVALGVALVVLTSG